MRNVLIIEDDVDIAELITYNLQKAGYKAHHAENANDGLIILGEVACDVILLDNKYWVHLIHCRYTLHSLSAMPVVHKTTVSFL